VAWAIRSHPRGTGSPASRGALHAFGLRQRELLSIPEADRALQSRVVAGAIRSLRSAYRGVLLETCYHGRSVAGAAAVWR
jgi:hypothetical protein